MRLHRWILLIAIVVAAAGCPKSPKRTRALPDVPTTGDATARARFQEARARFERDGGEVTAGEFETIAREFPDDPIVPFAKLYAGRAALRAGDYEGAAATLREVSADPAAEEALRRRTRLFLGFAYGYLGRYAEAVAQLDDPEAANDDGERGERFAVLAEAHAATGQPAQAFANLDAWFPLSTAPEREYIVARAGALAEGLDGNTAAGILDRLSGDSGPAALALASRVATDAAAAGNTELARRMQQVAARARAALGLDRGPRSRGGGDPQLVGATLPLSGKRNRVGEAALRGLGLAAGTFDRDPGRGVGVNGVPKPFVLSSRDSHSLADGAGQAVSQLVAEGAIAVVGPLDAASVRVAARTAADAGVPLIALDTLGGADSTLDSPYVFHIVVSAERRARALARHAVGKGVKRFAILRPDTNYGKLTAAAFSDEVSNLGGRVIAEVGYDRKATSFGDVVGKIRGKPWDAVFVPDVASRLELVVPALASANLVVLPAGAKEPKKGRKVMLLSTAEALRPKYLRGSGRYSWGAVFAPGFYADKDDSIIGDYVSRYEAAYGRDPTFLEAYAYDAALAIRAAVESGARTRAEVSAAVAASAVEGLTGSVRFGASRRRADDGLLFVVGKDAGGEYRIRAIR